LGPDGEGRPPDYTLQQLDQAHQYTPNYLPHYTYRAGSNVHYRRIQPSDNENSCFLSSQTTRYSIHSSRKTAEVAGAVHLSPRLIFCLIDL
jgi:hypothetical protein